MRLFGHEIELPGWRMAIVQVVLATVDVAVTATIFYALLPPASGLTWLRFLGVYVASYTAGLAANLPGGIGVFDTAMLIGLSPWLERADDPRRDRRVPALLLVIPLFLAGTLFAGNEMLLRGGSVLRRASGLRGVEAIGRWSEPEFAVAAATGSVALCGAMLLSVGVVASQGEAAWIDPDLVGVAVQASQFIPSLIGAGLMVLAIGLSQRVNLAWGATLVLLLAGAAFLVAQGPWPWMAGILVLAMMLVAPFRSCFYRHARLLSGPLEASPALPLFTLVLCILVLAAFERHVRFLDDNSLVGDRPVARGAELAPLHRRGHGDAGVGGDLAFDQAGPCPLDTWGPHGTADAIRRPARTRRSTPTASCGARPAGRHRVPPLRPHAAGLGRSGRPGGG